MRDIIHGHVTTNVGMESKDHELLPSLNLVAQCNFNKKLFHTGTFYGPPVP